MAGSSSARPTPSDGQGSGSGARPRRQSAYTRALIFIVLGTGCFIGAFAVHTEAILEESVDHLFEDRLRLARATGALLEDRVRVDLARVVPSAEPALIAHAAGEKVKPYDKTLARAYAQTLFTEGVLLLDSAGFPFGGVPELPAGLSEAVDLPALVAHIRPGRDVTVSPLVALGPRRFLVVATAVRVGPQVVGYVAALLHPAMAELLAPLETTAHSHGVRVELVDREGLVVGSTDQTRLFRIGDHDAVLADALAEVRPIHGRCHTCHEDEQRGVAEPADTDLMVFAPLPGLELGITVQEPEKEALVFAKVMRERTLWIGAGFLVLFIVFAGLSVHAVVAPIKRLTRAVREAGSDASGPLRLPSLGNDEMGELAQALEVSRQQALDALEAAEGSRDALHRQTEATRKHLQALQDIAAASTSWGDVEAILLLALDRVGTLLGVQRSAMWFQFQRREVRVGHGLSAEEAAAAFAAGAERADDDADTARVDVHIPEGSGLRCVVLGEGVAPLHSDPRLTTLVRQALVSATSCHLREVDHERQELQRQYLHRVLAAQEDERRRVARELHDTLAQDLSALRLEVERLAAHSDGAAVRAPLREMEGRVGDALEAVRTILLDLRLSTLEDLGLLPAVQQHLERLERACKIRGTLAIDGEELELDYAKAVTLYRIFQESANNAIAHGKAEQVFVTVTFDDHAVDLVVEDDGVGFDPDDVHAPGDGQRASLGILGMEERARLLGGSLTITSTPGEGTMVRAHVPLDDAAQAAS